MRTVLLLSLVAAPALAQAPPPSPPRPFPTSVPSTPLPRPAASVPVGKPMHQSPGQPFAPVPRGLPTSPAAVAPTAAPPPGEQLVTFDPGRVDLKWQDRQWVLVHGDSVLKDFGAREEDARRAWQLIRDLRLTQRGVLGRPQPVLEYWLAGGQPPRHLPRGLRTIPLDPAAVRVEQSQGHWVVRDATRVLFNFGTHADEAERALAVIRKHGFNQIAVVGQAVPSMLVFVARADLQSQPAAMNPDPAARRTRMPDLKAGNDARPDDKKGTAAQPQFYPTPLLPPLSSGTVVTHTRQPAAGRRGPGGLRTTTLTPAGAEEESAVPVITERVPFDYRQVHLQRDSGEWKLAAGGYVLARFGTNERDARVAHAAVGHYRLTEAHLVGGGAEPAAPYFLASGQAPRGLMVGVFSEPFRADLLNVRPVGERYWLANGNRPLLDCGDRPELARHVLDAVRRHGFDALVRVGSDPTQGLVFFVKSH